MMTMVAMPLLAAHHPLAARASPQRPLPRKVHWRSWRGEEHAQRPLQRRWRSGFRI